MPDRILDSMEYNVGGILTLGSGLAIQIYEYVTMENVNNFLELGLAVGGAAFLYFRIKGVKLDNESKKLDNEKKRREL